MVEHEEILNAVISSIGSASVTFVIYFHWLTLSFYLFQNIGGSNIDLTNNSLSIDDKDDALDNGSRIRSSENGPRNLSSELKFQRGHLKSSWCWEKRGVFHETSAKNDDIIFVRTSSIREQHQEVC